MTFRQKIILEKVGERIQDLRNMFDDLLLYSDDTDKLTDDQRSRLTEAKDYICKAAEKL